MKPPLISVIMPVYNSQTYLHESISSILSQTFEDFEFIIINDGSVDDSVDIISKFQDDRIRLINNKTNKGNYWARNIGFDKAEGKYYCIMDSDDISISNRLEVQFDYMEKNPEVGICGSLVRFLPSDKILNRPLSHEEIKISFIKNNYCTHPSLMIRGLLVKEYNLRYNEDYLYSADYDLVSRILARFKVVNLPNVLLKYRLHGSQISQKFQLKQKMYADRIRIKQLSNFDITPNEFEKQLHLQLVTQKYIDNVNNIRELQHWANFLLKQNEKTGYYNSILLANFLRNLLKNRHR